MNIPDSLPPPLPFSFNNTLLIDPGDGAGVGKGRTIAGIIYQNYLEGRKKALWFVMKS